jgi:D-alanyl-lipoteichoic acid acyltransferase DltB (MBOAT superfamily)
MLFNSIEYVIFLVIVLSLYWITDTNYRLILLLSASNFFYYTFQPQYIYLIYLIALIDFILAYLITSYRSFASYLLFINIIINLFILFFFKYYNFYFEIISSFLNEYPKNGSYIELILPLGISFYTFQSISYIVDVYKGKFPAQKKFLPYLCYIFFFPILIAGPLVRASQLIPQFSRKLRFSYINLSIGVKYILFGLFLKVVLADNLGTIVDELFLMQPKNFSATDVLTMSFLFGFQIYFDFSSYSLIAIGSALLFGIHLPKNFNFPYSASSPRDFWRRWNITLSKWIVDYIYIPLLNISNSNKSKLAPYSVLCLFLTWLIMGLWHGAAYNFILWGAYHALFILIYRLFTFYRLNLNIKFKIILGWGLSLPIIMLSWIFFRSPDLNYSITMFSKLVEFDNFFSISFRESYYLIAALILLSYYALFFWIKYRVCKYIPPVINKILNFIYYTMIIFLIFTYLEPKNQFIYFQF